MTSGFRVETRTTDGINTGDVPEEAGKAGEGSRSITGTYGIGACPKCGQDNQLVIVREGEVRVKAAQVCVNSDCMAELPYRTDVEAAIAEALAPKPNGKSNAKKTVEAVKEVDPDTEDDLEPVPAELD